MENESEQLSVENRESMLFDTFIGNPEKYSYYRGAAQKLGIGKGFSIGWHWSWWAFFAGWAYLLYRKAYLAALGSFVVGTLLSLVPFGLILYMILSGGLSVYFVLDRYAKLMGDIEGSNIDSAQDVMRRFGGVHTWVAWFAGVFYGLTILLLIVMVLDFGLIGLIGMI